MGKGERGVVGRGRGLSCTGVGKGSRGVIIREGARVSCPGEGEGGELSRRGDKGSDRDKREREYERRVRDLRAQCPPDL